LPAPAANPSFAIGGSAFLKPWFDIYRAEAQNGSITVAAGDSEGATPPISNFFGDTPTVEIMNQMGFNADGLGNHNFDRGAAYLRTSLIPLATFPFLSANVVDANGKTPAEWKPSTVFTLDGAKIGLVGFTNEDAPTLVSPTAFDPFHVVPRLAPVQAEVNKLRAQGVKSIVVMGHDGAIAGTISNPTGPLFSLSDNVTGVDVVIGDHTDFQVVSRRPNGVLTTENRSKGLRFTRVRLVIDPSTKSVVYSTADFHKPWNIGVTPDPTIQARIDDLNNQLKPIFTGSSASLDRRQCRAATPVHRGDGPGRRPGVRIARRRPRDRRDPLATTGGLRAHELRRAAGRADLPAAATDPNSGTSACRRSIRSGWLRSLCDHARPGARRACRSATSRRR
jgi:2',3'-cyclic-nucleotide 2'-phosphodiesterase (5'-nucleotidase family)